MKQKLLNYSVRLFAFLLISFALCWAQKFKPLADWEVYSRIGLGWIAWICITLKFNNGE